VEKPYGCLNPAAWVHTNRIAFGIFPNPTWLPILVELVTAIVRFRVATNLSQQLKEEHQE